MIVDFSEHSKAGTPVDISNFSTDLIHPSCDRGEASASITQGEPETV